MKTNKPISLGEPILTEREKEALCDVIDSGWITMGDRVAAFEKAFSNLHGVESAVAVNSCTAGLHLGLAALGIGPGDEVMVPSITFVATVNAVLYVGATPVFVDLEDADTPHLSIKDAEKKRTPHSKTVVVMHYGGYPVPMAEWRSFADSQGLMLIEDAAHSPAVGSVGKLSDATVFSFFTNKNMTTAEGGMVFARKPEVLERIRRMRAHGMTTGTLDRHRGHAYSYDVTMLGYNYRMDELRAAIGLVQLERLTEWNAHRRMLTELYRMHLAAQLPEVKIPFAAHHETAAHLMPILLPQGVDRYAVMDRLRADGIQTSIHYPPVHLFSYYQEHFPGISLPNTTQFYARELSLPLHASLDEEAVSFVVGALKKAIGRSR